MENLFLPNLCYFYGFLHSEFVFLVAAALDPEALYRSKFAQHRSAQLATTLALKKLASSPLEASAAIDQFISFSTQSGLFGIQEARYSALRGNISAGTYTVNDKISLLLFYTLSGLIVILFIHYS